MPVSSLRSIDVRSVDEEKLVQQVLDEKLSVLPPEREVYTGDVPDIQTGEDEAKWQKIIDDRRAALRPKGEEAKLEETIASLEEQKEDISLDATDLPVESTKKSFCDFCTSKGRFHKMDCTRPRTA